MKPYSDWEKIKESILKAQRNILGGFLQIQLENQFGLHWKTEVRNHAVEQDHNYPGHWQYARIIEKYDSNPDRFELDKLDNTLLIVLIRFCFKEECTLDNTTVTKYVECIEGDRNELSHIDEINSTTKRYITEGDAIQHLLLFIDHLRNKWNYEYKAEFLKKFDNENNPEGRLQQLLDQLWVAEGMYVQKKQADKKFESYLQQLSESNPGRRDEYVGLSFNNDARPGQKLTLKNLEDNCICRDKTGFRLMAKAGYGKTWTLQKIAGDFAIKYMSSNNGRNNPYFPLYIDLGSLSDSCNSIIEKTAQLFFEFEKDDANNFLNNNNVLLIVDAMDEATQDVQINVRRELGEFRQRDNIVLVCAARKTHINYYPKELPIYTIDMMNDSQIKDFINKVIKPEYQDKAISDWIGVDGEASLKGFLQKNRTPFYLKCYSELLNETGDSNFYSTTELQKKFLDMTIDRELEKAGSNTDKETIRDCLIAFCKLLLPHSALNHSDVDIYTLPKNETLKQLERIIPIENGNADIPTIIRKLVEISILAEYEGQKGTKRLKFAHEFYLDYIQETYIEE